MTSASVPMTSHRRSKTLPVLTSRSVASQQQPLQGRQGHMTSSAAGNTAAMTSESEESSQAHASTPAAEDERDDVTLGSCDDASATVTADDKTGAF